MEEKNWISPSLERETQLSQNFLLRNQRCLMLSSRVGLNWSGPIKVGNQIQLSSWKMKNLFSFYRLIRRQEPIGSSSMVQILLNMALAVLLIWTIQQWSSTIWLRRLWLTQSMEVSLWLASVAMKFSSLLKTKSSIRGMKDQTQTSPQIFARQLAANWASNALTWAHSCQRSKCWMSRDGDHSSQPRRE